MTSGRLVTEIGKEVFFSALLFHFYLNDGIERTVQIKMDCKLYAKSYSISHANDIALSAPSMTGLQRLIDKVSEATMCSDFKSQMCLIHRSIFRDKHFKCKRM